MRVSEIHTSVFSMDGWVGIRFSPCPCVTSFTVLIILLTGDNFNVHTTVKKTKHASSIPLSIFTFFPYRNKNQPLRKTPVQQKCF